MKTGDVLPMEKYLKEVYQEMKNEIAKKMDHQKLGITIKVRVVVGYPSDKILECEKEERVDLIVIGTVGRRSAFKVAVLGSVARKVSEVALCPVILVH